MYIYIYIYIYLYIYTCPGLQQLGQLFEVERAVTVLADETRTVETDHTHIRRRDTFTHPDAQSQTAIAQTCEARLQHSV